MQRDGVRRWLGAASLLAIALIGGPAGASPWAEPGDEGLRGDIERLAAYGLIDGPLMAWPIPWAQLAPVLSVDIGTDLPPAVRASLQRVRSRLLAETRVDDFMAQGRVAMTNGPALVRGFGDTARREIDAIAGVEYLFPSTAFRVNLGYQDSFGGFLQDVDLGDELVLDGSYIAQELGNWLFYAGALDHWWGPGWVSSNILSTNARPFPRVGVMRNNPHAFETPWLSWIGPWQVEAFLGVLEEQRRVENPLVIGLRASIQPLPGLELGASRVLQICGEDRPCGAGDLATALFEGSSQSDRSADIANQLASLEARYTGLAWTVPFSIYGQLVGDDLENAGPLPFIQNTGHLIGASVWGDLGDDGAGWRLTAEFSNTAPSDHVFDEPVYNSYYNSDTYGPQGYRYRDRAIGNSLDNDTCLYSVTGTLTDVRGWVYRLAYHHADLNRDDLNGNNTVSESAERINIVEASLSVPWQESVFDFAVRAYDNQPDPPDRQAPGHDGTDFEAEVRWRFRY